MKNSTLHPEMYLSAEACEDKNERMILMRKKLKYQIWGKAANRM